MFRYVFHATDFSYLFKPFETKIITQFLFDEWIKCKISTYRPPRMGLLMVFLSPTREMLGYYLKLRHNFLPNNVFPTHHSPIIYSFKLCSLYTDRAVRHTKNKTFIILTAQGQGQLNQCALPQDPAANKN
jgi:hypothetical protein